MGRRFNILVGMALAVAVVVPLAFAQRQDSPAKAAEEVPLNLAEPPSKDSSLPPAADSNAKPGIDTPKSSAATKDRSKAASKRSRTPAPKKTAPPGASSLDMEPTPGEPLTAETLGATSPDNSLPSTSRPQGTPTSSSSDRLPGASVPERLPGEAPAPESENEVPALPKVDPLDRPLSAPSSLDAALPGGVPRESPLAEERPLQPGGAEPGQLPRAGGGTIDPEILRSEGPAPGGKPAAGVGTIPPDPQNPLPAAATGPAGDPTMGARAQLLPASTIPLIGKQTFGLTVDVQSPHFANINQEATFKIIVRNGTEAEALHVVVAEELPAGLDYVSSVPPTVPNDKILVWSLNKIPAGSDRTITVRVRPTKVGVFDHAATVTMFAAGKSRTIVREPKLKVEQVASKSSVEKGQEVDFKIRVSNTGDGPARDVLVQATLSAGLHHESGKPNEPTVVEFPIARLEPGHNVEIEPLFVDTVAGGDQTCTVVVKSRDVVPTADSKAIQTVRVVEPRLDLKISGPVEQYTDTEAVYTLSISNPGTAPARKIAVRATLQVSGQLVAASQGYKYDPNSRNLDWSSPQLDPGETQKFTFRVRMGAVGEYRVNAVARGTAGLLKQDFVLTSVTGMADVNFTVTENRRVVSIDDETTFTVKITNSGSKDATNVLVSAKYSDTIEPLGPEVDSNEKDPSQALMANPATHQLKFQVIPNLPHGKSKVLSVRVKAVKAGIANCEFTLMHDDLEGTKLNGSAILRVKENVRR